MLATAGSAAVPAARCKNVRRGSLMAFPPEMRWRDKCAEARDAPIAHPSYPHAYLRLYCTVMRRAEQRMLKEPALRQRCPIGDRREQAHPDRLRLRCLWRHDRVEQDGVGKAVVPLRVGVSRRGERIGNVTQSRLPQDVTL